MAMIFIVGIGMLARSLMVRSDECIATIIAYIIIIVVVVVIILSSGN